MAHLTFRNLTLLQEQEAPRSELVGTISESLLRAQIHVLGRVLLAGKVIEHAEGYRAERARIAELIPVKGTEGTVARLAAALGLPMGAAV